MTKKQKDFINTIGTLARNEYLSRKKWILPSICIAQAIQESGWNLKASTLFGIKAVAGQESFVSTTTEYYNNNKVIIQDAFVKYPDVASAVVGYYNFTSSIHWYAEAINNPDYRTAIYGIDDGKNDNTDGLAMYATDPNYEKKIIELIEQHNLTEWDKRDDVPTTSVPKAEEGLQIHVVKAGDTLNKIAKNYEVTVEQISEANGIKNINLIKVGQRLIIPCAGYPVKVTAAALNVRDRAGVAQSKILSVVHKNDILRITKEQSGWGLSPKGWVNLKYTSKI